jgi:multicomponent Na+:H+ antiporter subunit G
MLVIAWSFALLGSMAMLIAALGIVRLPDALARQHAATKAATFSVSLFVMGLLFYVLASGFDWSWIVRLLMLMVVMFFTLPLAAHALIRSALCENDVKPFK